MENIRNIFRKMNWKNGLFSFLALLLFLFLIQVAISPLQKMKEYNQLAVSDSLFMAGYDSAFDDPELKSLVKDRTYKTALLQLSESDSIQLAINLYDSTANLFINGVLIHRTSIPSFKTDRLLKGMPLKQQIRLLSRPLPVHAQYATIVKEPIVVRHAPKDTLEAALNAWQPDTLIQNPAYCMLSLDFGIRLVLEQEDNPRFRDSWVRFVFYSRLKGEDSLRALVHFLSFRKQEYHPCISIKMPVNDLRAIYRALPGQAYVVLAI